MQLRQRRRRPRRLEPPQPIHLNPSEESEGSELCLAGASLPRPGSTVAIRRVPPTLKKRKEEPTLGPSYCSSPNSPETCMDYDTRARMTRTRAADPAPAPSGLVMADGFRV